MKILIVKLGALGDVINTFPAVIRLKKHFNAEIHWLVAPLSYPVVKNHSCVDKAILFNRDRKHGWIQTIKAVKDTIKIIRNEKYDITFDFQRTLKSGFFCLTAKSSKKLGFDKKRCKEFTWLYPFTRITPPNPCNTRHMLEQYLDFTDYLGIKKEKITWDIPRNTTCIKNLHESNLLDKYIVLNIGATKKANLWPIEHFAALADLIHENTAFRCVLTGGGSTDDKRARLILKFAKKPIINLVGKTDIMQLIEVIGKACEIVSCDTGPMHLAIALGKTTIALFGPSDPVRTGPYVKTYKYKGQIISKSLPCSPCNRKKCHNPVCMKMITPEEVFRAITDHQSCINRLPSCESETRS